MTAAEFKRKWSRYQGKETSAYQTHFDDLCRLLGQPTPSQADPSGTDFFCFQKRVIKDQELFGLEESTDAGEPAERGFADVWKKDCFAWEYKGKKKNLDEAYKQLLRYRESLLNPPLLVVCDFDRYIIRTNFNGTVQEVHEFTNEQIDRPENIRILRSLFEFPDFLKPQRTTAGVTEVLAQKIAEVAKSLQKRESAELTDAQSRAEVNVAQRKNLRIARFLNRIVFCMFAEDTRLLPADLFTEILKAAVDDAGHFAKTLEDLFNVMATGGNFGQHKIRHFNGHLFDDSSVFELNEMELRILGDAAEADWQFIQPSIMGTLFERALDDSQRSQLGAHYTSEADIKTLVEPVLMQPYRREWSQIKGELAAAYKKGKGNAANRERLSKFQKQLAAVTVLDPACGSGNFLYVSLQLLLGLEKEVITFATQLGFSFKPQVAVSQLKAIEINPYAFELAQVSVQIGYLQWRRDNGFDNDRSPVLQNLDGFQNEDALLVPHFRNKAKSLREARAGEHKIDDALKFYTEREWPECSVIVSNPPFLGSSFLRRQISDSYVDALFENFGGKVAPGADLCCYWVEKARDLIAKGRCKRAGLLATQGIRGGANREALKRVEKSGGIFFAVSDRDWILAGANVHVSMVGFDAGVENLRILDGVQVNEINSNLTSHGDTTEALALRSNAGICLRASEKGGGFTIEEGQATDFFRRTNPNGKPNSDVIRPWINGDILLTRPAHKFIIDYFGMNDEAMASQYEAPFEHLRAKVQKERQSNRDERLSKFWWLHRRSAQDMRAATKLLPRFIATPALSKHRLFAWLDHPTLPDHQLSIFARADNFAIGLLHSRLHAVWSLAQGTQLREKESGFRYTPTTCFETFPFPRPNPKEESAIAVAAKELNELRERWLNPPEWTRTRSLEFPGSAKGPWSRFIAPKSVNAKTGIGTVRYPRLEPRDAECAVKLKKHTLTNLYNERPAWLDLAHKKLDAAVAEAYGWPADLCDEQILEKLLALNLERAAEEAKTAKTQKPRVSREKNGDELV